MKNAIRLVPVVFILSFILVFIGCDRNGQPVEGTNDIASAKVEWLTGTTNPDQAQGVDSDLYMNTTTGDVFVRTSGAWTLAGNVTGPSDPEGTQRTRMFEMFDHVVLAADVIPYWQSPKVWGALHDDRSEQDGYTVHDALALSRVLQAVNATRDEPHPALPALP